MGSEFLQQNSFIILIVSIIVLLLLIFLFVTLIKRPHKKEKKVTLDPEFVTQLLLALGGPDNILAVEIHHQRLHVTLKNAKTIVASLLKSLDIPAVLTQNQIKLLLKHNIESVYQFLSEIRKEENK